MKTKFRIITPAYNCADEIKNTLYSIIGQTYDNWTLVVCDDMSTDATVDIILDLMKNNNVLNKVEIVRRNEKYGEVRNTLEEVARADANEVIIRLDAGDWLTDLGCLEILSGIYEEYDPAVLWTSQRWSFTDYSISGPIDIGKNIYDQPWRTSHLKTFRVKDFLGLNPKNFLDDEGNYIMIACDQAIFLPMLERARRSGRPLIYLPRVMYHYNIDLNDKTLFQKPRSIEQKMSAERIRERGFIE